MILNFEASVVTHLLNNNEYNPDIQSKHFAHVEHKTIWEAAHKLISEQKEADLFTVCDVLGQQWSTTIVEMMADALPPKDMYIDVIKAAYKKREMQSILSNSEDLEVNEIIAKLTSLEETKGTHTHTLDQSLKAAIHLLDDINQGNVKPAIPTGIKRYDELNGGLHDSDLYIIGGRSGTGKTAFVINMLLANDQPTLFASSEQGAIQVAQRILSVQGQVPLNKMRSASFNSAEWDHLSRACSTLKGRDLIIYDHERPTVADIEREARKMEITTGISCIAIDYVGRIESGRPTNTKKEAIAGIVKDCKSMAKRLDVPVILLSQLKRDSYGRIPNEADLADATELECEADVIMLLHREHTYNEQADPTEADLIIPKNRHGQPGFIPLHWHGPTLSYTSK